MAACQLPRKIPSFVMENEGLVAGGPGEALHLDKVTELRQFWELENDSVADF